MSKADSGATAQPTAEMIAQFETGLGAVFSPKKAFQFGWDQAMRSVEPELAGCRACRAKIDCISRNEKANDYSDRVRELERVLEVEIKLLVERHPRKFLEASLGYEALLWKRLTAALRKDAP